MNFGCKVNFLDKLQCSCFSKPKTYCTFTVTRQPLRSVSLDTASADFEEEETTQDNTMKMSSESFKLYPNHVPTTSLQKALLAVGSAFMGLYDPTRQDMIAALGETTGYPALKWMHSKMVNDPVGQEILRLQPRITGATAPIEELRKLPDGTLGREYARFMTNNVGIINPFSCDPTLRSIVTGVVADNAVNVHKSKEVGNKILSFMVGLPRQANKPALADAIWGLVKNDETRITGLQGLPWPRGLTYDDIFTLYVEYVTRSQRIGDGRKLTGSCFQYKLICHQLTTHCFRSYAATNISADTRTPVKFVDDTELAYVIQRYRDVHDFMHVLSGIPTVSVAGEIAVKWFEMVHTGLPMCALASFFGPLNLNVTAQQRQDLLLHYIPWAVSAGLKANFILNVFFERRFEEPLDTIREELNLSKAPKIEG
ncbi:hypothetical protein QZH41_019440 [Actinostola sp. cb2023]|nr:hypothetical protein QZH41_019440 [Actinostola sp. cb2023]